MTSIGLDLGACTTRLALLDRQKPMPVIIRNELSNEATSTVVYYNFDQGERRCYGETASSKSVTKVKETVLDLTDWLYSKTGERALGKEGETFNAMQVAAYFIKCMLRLLPRDKKPKQEEEEEEKDASLSLPLGIAVPPAIPVEGIQALRQAALTAGVKKDCLSVCRSDEALAVYLHHLQYNSFPAAKKDGEEGEERFTWVVVLDIGHDWSTGVVVKVNQGRVVKVASQALEMGSSYIDAALCQLINDELAQKIVGTEHASHDLKGDVKLQRKILKESKKAKEVLSTTEETKVTLEGILGGEMDFTLPVSRSKYESLIHPFTTALETMLKQLQQALPPSLGESDNSLEASYRVEAIGGGWRAPVIAALIQSVFHIPRVGVSLDANLAVAEGAAILMEVLAGGDKDGEGERHAVHNVVLESFEATDATAAVCLPLTEAQEKEVQAYQETEARLSAMDACIQERLTAINDLDTFVLQSLQRISDAEEKFIKGEVEREERGRQAQQYLNEVDDYLRGDCNGEPTEAIESKRQAAVTYLETTLPELQQHAAEQQQAKEKKEEELRKMSEAAAKEADEGDGMDALKSDPQRLRMAQRRREQGATLFKEECYAEAQKRFVQALAILGELYDLKDENTVKEKNTIALSCHLNIASCSYKLELYKNCISNATSALELSPQHPKAHFRRGQGYLQLKEYAPALEDLKMASQLLGGKDTAVEAELARCRQLQEKEKAREKKMFSKMFA